MVTSGNFKIDSAIQLLAKPSMMSPEGGAPPSAHAQHGMPAGKPAAEMLDTPQAFREQIDGVLAFYFRLHHALSRDDPEAARAASGALDAALGKVDMAVLAGDDHVVWMDQVRPLARASAAASQTDDIDVMREHFGELTVALTVVVKQLGTGGAHDVLEFYCPMAFGSRGANWLQNKEGAENPYLGEMMFECGDQTATLATRQP